jgi:two-component system cell cycle sensor histidine kinase/response regulator CckA
MATPNLISSVPDLENAAKLYKVLIQDLQDYAIFTIGPDGVITSWNAGVERILGYPEDKFVGRQFSMLFSPEDISAGVPLDELNRASRSGHAPDKRWHVRADGSRLFVDGTLTALHDPEQDRVVGHLKIMRDDTDRALASVELEKSERNYRFLAESIPEIVWTAGPQGAVDYYNQHWYQFTGLTREHSEGWEWQNALHPEDHDECLRQWTHSIATGEPLDVECRFRRADGSYCSHIRRAVAQKDEQGRVLKWFGTCTDIEEQKQAEKALWQAAKLESIGVLAGGVAHDFNNLLTGILGNTSIALEMLSPNHPVRSVLESAMRASKSAADLTQQLLAYAGKGRIELKPVNLSNIIREISSLIESSIPKTVTVNLELAPRLPLIEADINQMKQIIMNLIINGAEAIGNAHGTVTITTRTQFIDETYVRSVFSQGELKPGQYAVVEVQDTGSGMDEATVHRVFDPFFTTKFTGRGLGLAAVLGIMRSHKGAIELQSTPGRGTAFRLLLPVVTASVHNGSSPAEQQQAAGNGVVLVVDDQPAVRDVAQAALRMYGYSVLTAENGLHAIEVFREHKDEVKVVIMDLTMPVMDGREALKHLRALRSDVKVIISSGYSEADAVQKFSSDGLAGFLQKPYTARRLGEVVSQAVRQA